LSTALWAPSAWAMMSLLSTRMNVWSAASASGHGPALWMPSSMRNIPGRDRYAPSFPIQRYLTTEQAGEEDAAGMLKDIKESDLGLSLVVSGIFDCVKGMCQKNGIHRHAATYSLGIWGKTEKLPPDEVLDVITMCGHGMVSAGRVNAMADEVRAGRKSAEDAAKELASQCDCGVFNPSRTAKLLAALAK